MYSSLSVIPYPRLVNFSIGSWIRSLRDLHQVKAPEIGGILRNTGAFSCSLSTRIFPSKNIDYTCLRSCLYISKRTMCFFSSSSYIIGRFKRPSKLSKSLNLP